MLQVDVLGKAGVNWKLCSVCWRRGGRFAMLKWARFRVLLHLTEMF